MTGFLVAAGSADPDPAHAPKYGWPIAVLFGLFVLALVGWSLWLRFGSVDGVKWGSAKGERAQSPGADEPLSSERRPDGLPPLGSEAPPSVLPGLGRPAVESSGRLPGWRGLFKTYTPAVPPPTAGPFPTREVAEARARELDEEFADHLNQYQGYFEVVADGDGFRLVERRGRQTPRAVPGSLTGGLGP